MLTRKHEPIVFAFILSGLMSCLVSGLATLRALGLVPGFPGIWLQAWLTSCLVTFPAAVVVAPIARRLAHAAIERLAAPEDQKSKSA